MANFVSLSWPRTCLSVASLMMKFVAKTDEVILRSSVQWHMNWKCESEKQEMLVDGQLKGRWRPTDVTRLSSSMEKASWIAPQKQVDVAAILEECVVERHQVKMSQVERCCNTKKQRVGRLGEDIYMVLTDN